MQHATPCELLGRVFGALESVIIASRAIGPGVTPLLFQIVGIRGTFIIVGAFLPLVTLPVWRRLRRLDARPALGAVND
jgi:MFS family permease